MLTGGNLIALRVASDSMIGAAIADGDWVLVRRQPDADSGDVVPPCWRARDLPIAEATVKTLKEADGHVWLIPHNPAYSPMMAGRKVVP